MPHFTRVVTEDHELGGVQLRTGDRVMVLFGSANRDERAFDDPDRFDVARRGTEHLAFGRGEHSCIGMQLARLEMDSLLRALARRVQRFEILESVAAGGEKFSRIFSLEDGHESITIRADREALQPLQEAERKIAYATGEADHWRSELADANRRKESETESIGRVTRARIRAEKALAVATKASDAKTAAKTDADKALADANIAVEAAKAKKDAAASAAANVRAAADGALSAAAAHQRDADERQRDALRQFVEASSALERAQQTMASLMKALASGQSNLAKAVADIGTAESSQKAADMAVTAVQSAPGGPKGCRRSGFAGGNFGFHSRWRHTRHRRPGRLGPHLERGDRTPAATLHGHAGPVLAVASGLDGAILSAAPMDRSRCGIRAADGSSGGRSGAR